MQLFYDTSRDWVRIFVPQAVLGIYSPEEMIEYGPDNARDVTPGSDLRSRLSAGERAQTGEGFMAGHVEREISRMGNPTDQIDLEDVISGRVDGTEAKDSTGRAPNRHERAIAAAKASAGRVADRAERTGKAKAKAATQAHAKPSGKRKAEQQPETPAEYTAFAEAWIKAATDPDEAEARWEGEQALREACLLPAKERNRIHFLLQKRFED